MSFQLVAAVAAIAVVTVVVLVAVVAIVQALTISKMTVMVSDGDEFSGDRSTDAFKR